MKHLKLSFGLFILLGIFGTLQTASIGKKINDFKLKDYTGKEISLYQFQDKKGVVIMFIATQCPVSNAYNERMVQLSKDYSTKGIQFIGINSNKQENIEEITKHAKEHGFEFPVLKDERNVIADRLGAQVTPEIFLIGPDKMLLYHGRVDDSANRNKVKENDLRNVLDAFLASQPLPKTETKAFGCTIKRID